MKRFLCMLLACVITAGLSLMAKEIVTLKNGSIIKGDIIEETPGVSLKLKTADGSIFVYKMDEIALIQRQVKGERNNTLRSEDDCNIRHRGLDYSVTTGLDLATKGSGITLPFEVTATKRFSPNISAGLGVGAVFNLKDFDDNPVLPFMAHFNGYMPLENTKLTPFLNVRAGFGLNLNDGYSINVGTSKHPSYVHVETPNYVMFSIMPGLRFPLNHKTDMDLAIGYEHNVPVGVSNAESSGAFAIRVGFNFHHSTDPNYVPKVKPKKEPNPVWNSGFEFGLEADGIGVNGGSLLLGYKFSNKISFALGIQGGRQDFTEPYETVTSYRGLDGTGKVLFISTYSDSERDMSLGKVYVRGQYRTTNKKWSPLASVDVGYSRSLNWEDWHFEGDEIIDGLFVRPAVGISLRIGSNSYLELRGGYDFAPPIPKVDKKIVNYNQYSEVMERDRKSLSSVFVGLSWKHTFPLFSRH